MAASAVLQIKLTRIAGPKPLHGLGKIGILGFKQDMVVIAHQHISMHLDTKPIDQLLQEI